MTVTLQKLFCIPSHVNLHESPSFLLIKPHQKFGGKSPASYGSSRSVLWSHATPHERCYSKNWELVIGCMEWWRFHATDGAAPCCWEATGGHVFFEDGLLSRRERLTDHCGAEIFSKEWNCQKVFLVELWQNCFYGFFLRCVLCFWRTFV